MKKKKSSILGVALTLMLLGSLLAAAVPVSAGTLSWTSVTIPSTTNEVLEAIDVVDIAVYDADTIFAGGGGTAHAAAILYKTTDRGVTWSKITTDNNTDLVAVAPDDPDIIVYADTAADTLKIWVTINGGTTWGDLGTPQEGSAGIATGIRDIAISAASAGIHYIAVAGNEGGVNPAANVWYYNVGAAAPAWTELNDKSGFSTTRTDVAGSANVTAAVAFSPNFPSDLIMTAVIGEYDGDGGTDNITVEMFTFNTKLWNTAAGFTGYPVTFATDDKISGLTSASISLSPEYLGSDDALRMAFVGVTVAGTGDDADAIATSGIYRLDDISVKALKTGSTVKTHSIAFDGTNLVAGRYDGTYVWRSADPLATTPTVSTSASLKSPGGVNRTVVAWAGDDVVTGTSGDESAFAVSKNNGKSFNDISLIATTLDNLRDVVVSPDEAKVYLVTDQSASTDLSLWRKASSWERVLTVQNKGEFIVRIAPDDPDVVYVAEAGSTTIYYSSDAGEEKWHLRTSRYSVVDLAVEGSGDVAYVLTSGGTVSRSENAGFTWGSAKSTGLGNGNMIVSLGEDKLLVGGTTGYVAYSTDGNSSWTKITSQVNTSGTAVQVTADGLDTDNYIYAASQATGKDIRRWEIGTSTSWSDIISGTITTASTDSPASTAMGVFGLVLQDGVLYALASNGTDSGVWRTLSPSTATSTTTWSYKLTTDADDVAFELTPQALRVSTGSTKLWAVDKDNDKLYSYTDTIAAVGPTLTLPADGTVVSVNPITGYAMDVTFTWEKPSTGVTAYAVKFYDADGNLVDSETATSTSSTVSFVVGKDIGDTNTSAQFTFVPGQTYSWKVRVSSPILSQYSEERSFSIAEAEVAPPVEIVVPPPAEIIVKVPPPPPPTKVEIPPLPAPITPAYIWAIIIIGAVLVIAVIVLIVRTRRVV